MGVIEQTLRDDIKNLLRREPVCKPIGTVEKEEQHNLGGVDTQSRLSDARHWSTSSISVLYTA